ncbi:hypothetical protein K439DRAFT_442932 [Ramaria rubella]|nr:hypothetical protein K439DRAFT_442932 [Ramaria rubella]
MHIRIKCFKLCIIKKSLCSCSPRTFGNLFESNGFGIDVEGINVELFYTCLSCQSHPHQTPNRCCQTSSHRKKISMLLITTMKCGPRQWIICCNHVIYSLASFINSTGKIGTTQCFSQFQTSINLIQRGVLSLRWRL